MALSLSELQNRVGIWGRRNFPSSTSDEQLLGVFEEAGELAHAVLKGKQGIRYTKQQAHMKKKDAIGDIVVFLANYCEHENLDLQDIVEQTWNQVEKRDWTKNKLTSVEQTDITMFEVLMKDPPIKVKDPGWDPEESKEI